MANLGAAIPLKLFNRRQRQRESDMLDKLLQAVVSLYLHMARMAKLQGGEINFIDLLLRSMFGNDIPLYKIEQARQEVMPIREAANLLNEHLGTADRLKIILNLISLAYHDRSKIHVLGSMEIVELTDLLRLDVSALDTIYDLFENRLDSIDLPGAVSSSGSCLLRNSMVWAPVNGDFKFNGTGKGRLFFIMVESLVLLYPELAPDAEQCKTWDGRIERSLSLNHFHCLREGSCLIVPGAGGGINLRVKDLWFIYNLGSTSMDLPLVGAEDKAVRVISRNHRFYLQPGRTSKLALQRELALDDPVSAGQPSLLEILTGDTADRDLLATDIEYYLCQSKSGLSIKPENDSNALLHFFVEQNKLMVQLSGDRSIYINRKPLKAKVAFVLNQDILSIGSISFLINRQWELIEIPIQVNELAVNEVSHQFSDGRIALAGVFFRMAKCRMMAIMGPSGSGKTTLLQVLLGNIKATSSRIQIDNQDYHAHYDFYSRHIGYVPQDDLLFPNLTVYENLYYRIRLALPNLNNRSEISTRIRNLLHSVGLYEQRNMIVGDVMNKRLSGGQRRRLNIALELVLNPVIIILDEPTSGLSSKDSENIVQFLSELKQQSKIIICTIHQPNATVFKSFDQVLLLDKGGRQVYFGDTDKVFGYFESELKLCNNEREYLSTKRDLLIPDYFYDLIETTDNLGNRRFPPEYWERKFRDFSFRLAINTSQALPEPEEPHAHGSAPKRKKHPWRNLLQLTGRGFINKSRSRINLLMTLIVAPLLAAITAFVLRGVPDGEAYSFLANQNSLLFGFISVIIFIFIGLANSIDDLLGEKRSIQRESKLNISPTSQLVAKQVVLFSMTLIQVLLFYLISSRVLDFRGYLLPHGIFLLLSGVAGYSLGLFSSSMIKDRSAIVNVLPLIIIPQIMFSGAVIIFSEMNASLRINRHSEVPEFCQLIPSRWLYEGWVVGSARINTTAITKQRYLNLIKDANLPYPEYMKLVKSNNAFTLSHPESRYDNELLRSSVKLSHGQYLNEGRNIFLSHRISVFNKEYSTLLLDALVLLAMAFALSVLTWWRLCFAFNKG